MKQQQVQELEMINSQTGLISDNTYQSFNRLMSGLSSEHLTLISNIKYDILSNIHHYIKIPDFRAPVEKVETLFLKNASHYPQNIQTVLKRAMITILALHLPNILEKMNLPASIMALYPDAFERLANFLESIDNEPKPYDSTGEFFCKDVRFVLGLSVPCGARVVDMNSCISLQSVILSMIRSTKINGLILYLRKGGTGRWFRGHVESRYVAEFNEKGNDNHYLRVAELLKLQKDIKGFVITSWYYDPQVMKISPRLAYLHDRPRERGAFFLRHGASQRDIENAIKKSTTRRRLHEEGKYKPTCYSMVWPREELIAWADQRSIIPNHD